jgi:hypothetical protein
MPCEAYHVGLRLVSDPFKEFAEQVARLSVLEDDTEDNREGRVTAASESGRRSSSSTSPISSLRRRRVPVRRGAGAVGDDPPGAGADRANLTSKRAWVHAERMTNCGPVQPQIHFPADRRRGKRRSSNRNVGSGNWKRGVAWVVSLRL